MTSAELTYLAAGIPIGGIITVLIQRHHATWLHWRARRRIRRHGLVLVDADGWHPSQRRKATK